MYTEQTVGFSQNNRNRALRVSQNNEEYELMHATPDRNMLCAIVIRALMDLRQRPETRQHRDARAWLRGGSEQKQYSLTWILTRLDYNLDYALPKIKRLTDNIVAETVDLYKRLDNGEKIDWGEFRRKDIFHGFETA